MKKFIQWFAVILAQAIGEYNNRFYPRYHLAPPKGWMNDPNGFSNFLGEYHLFYQHNPYSSRDPGIAHWGHAVSKDMFHWQHYPIVMYPDQPYDRDGVFSGSALIEGDGMYLYYTGNVRNPASQTQALSYSHDGVHIMKFDHNPVITLPNFQPNIRDPKVWKHDDTYYMILGNSFQNNTRGRALLYTAKDYVSWEFASVIGESDGSLGYMWECPDLFELDGYFVLLFSPQGIQPYGDLYRNLYQTGYIIGLFDYKDNKFHPLTKFRELDRGHDFYASQTMLDSSGRRIVIAWLDMWEQNYPEGPDGFTGLMTIPRVLSLNKNLEIIQTPVVEVSNVRINILHNGPLCGDKELILDNKAAEIDISAQADKNFELIFEGEHPETNISYVKLSYNCKDNRITLQREGRDGIRRTVWKPRGHIIWKIYVDASSIELFAGYGEATFSSRFFPGGRITFRLGRNSCADHLKAIELNRTVPELR